MYLATQMGVHHSQFYFLTSFRNMAKLFYALSILIVLLSITPMSVHAQSFAEMIKIVAPDREADDYFGSVAISGDYAIVGAYNEDENITGTDSLHNAGSAYIFQRNPITNSWSLQQKIVASDRGEDANFGNRVAINGDYAVIGAFQEDKNVTGTNRVDNAGSVYIFQRNSSTNIWNQQQKIVASDRGKDDYFGNSVAINGDYIVVGAYREEEDITGTNRLDNAGSAYIFRRNSSTNAWGQQQKIVASDRGEYANFGTSVAVSGDYIIVGAYRENEDATGANSLNSSGSAYVFQRNPSNNTWSQQQKIVASDREALDNFGISVAISGDYTIIGAYRGNKDVAGANSLNDAGSAYIFQRNTSTNAWSQQQKIVASDREEEDNFGISVDISGDYAIIGAYQEDDNITGANKLYDAGSAYIFRRNSSTNSWNQQQKIAASDRGTLDNFGASVAIDGDYAIVGAYKEDEDIAGANSLNNTGSTYIFNLIVSPPSFLTQFSTKVGDDVRISPVPTYNWIHINNKDASLIGQPASVYNIHGAELFHLIMAAEQDIDISAWPTGIYNLRLSNGKVVRLIKL